MTKSPSRGVVGLVLAAGAGRRFGGPKALVLLGGERLVDRAVRVLGDGGVTDVVVVAGAAPLEVVGATVVDNPDWDSGMGSSLRVGLAAVAFAHPLSPAVLVVPVDQPGLTPDAVRRVVGAATLPVELALVCASYAGRQGHPVLLGREHWSDIVAGAHGDVGARPVFVARADIVVRVECADIADGADVDEPADLQAWRGLAEEARVRRGSRGRPRS